MNLVFASPDEITIGAMMAGYDAIFQFRLDLINAQFSTSLQSKPYRLEAHYQFTGSVLSSRVEAAVAMVLSKVNRSRAPAPRFRSAVPVYGDAGTPGDLGPFWIQWFRISFDPPTLEISEDPDKEVIITWPVTVWLRMARGKLMTPGEGEFLDEPLASGRAVITGSIALETDPAKSQTWAVILPRRAAPSILSTDPLFEDLLLHMVPSANLEAAINSLLAPLLADTIRVTPTMCIGGMMQPGESLPGYTNFNVYKAKCRDGDQWVISIFLDAMAGGAGTGVTQVRSCVGRRNFAYCFSKGIAQAVIAQRWARSSTLKSFTTTSEVPLQDPDNENNTVYGSATVSWAWKNLVSTMILHTVDGAGAVRVNAIGEIKILELRDHKGQKLNPNDRPELFQPVTKGWAVDHIMFESVPPSVNRYVAIQGMQLLKPLYRPTASELKLSNISGLLSGSTFGGIVRGDLDTEAM
ncbi:MAG: hypothetical protein M1436_07920 [Acidobacteria bacterium]|nr:hypothetical protein [Acidobacteriota bacterium]